MFKALRDGLSPKAKKNLAIVMLLVIVVGGVVGYKFWDYKENNPKFCVSCHLMDVAYAKWESSEHKMVNCHECHHLSIIEQNQLMLTLIMHNPKEVPDRHGKVIVPWKYCANCHVDKNEKFPDAIKIKDSPFHAKHAFAAKIECTKCHGYKTHVFTTEPGYCLTCHKDKEPIHGMPGLECFACHTDKSVDLKPTRDKCLACHGCEAARKNIATQPETLDVKHFKPTAEQVEKACKMTEFPEDGAMKFECYKCHKPHGQIKPVVEADCLPCHKDIKKKGKHPTHLDMGLKCLNCHIPHGWKVSQATLKSKKCSQECHGVNNPKNFMK